MSGFDFAGGNSGERNTASNEGTAGVGLFKEKEGANLKFKKLNAGSNKVSVTDDTTNGEVDVDVVEANLTLGNLGGTLGIGKGGTGQTSQTAAFDALAPSTTKGDLFLHNGTDNVRPPVGGNGQVLTADSAESSGVKWTDAAGGSGGAGLTFTALQTANYTAAAGDFVRCDPTSGSFTVTLPASPAANDQVGVIRTLQGNSPNTVTVSAGATTIRGNHDKKLYVQDDCLVFQFDGSVWQTVREELAAHRTTLEQTTQQSIPHSTFTSISFNAKPYDVGQIGDTTTSRVTIRRRGRYLVHASWGAGQIANGEWAAVQIRLNGTTDHHRQTGYSANATPDNIGVISCGTMELFENEYLEMRVAHTAGQAELTQTGVTFRPTLTVAELR